MDYKVASISFVFENCDSVSFVANQIGDCQIQGIHETIRRVAMNAIVDSDVANEVFIEIAAAANKQHVPFGIGTDLSTGVKTVFERIKEGDITQIVLVYENGLELTLYVPFKSEYVNNTDSGCRNTCQDTYISENGLHLCISNSGKKAIDYMHENCRNGSAFLDVISMGLKEQADAGDVKPFRMDSEKAAVYINTIGTSDMFLNLKNMHESGEDSDNMYERYYSDILDLLRVHGYDTDWVRETFEPQLADLFGI